MSLFISIIAILIGLGTRFFSFSLIILTVVATAAVHWPADWGSLSELFQGYAVSNKGFGNYKLPVLYVAMFLPLLFQGAGKLSLDYLLPRMLKRRSVPAAVTTRTSSAAVRSSANARQPAATSR